MSYSVTPESFDSLTSYWQDPTNKLKWGSVFVLPAWLEVWWRHFQPTTELYLRAVREDSEIIGIAPLQIKDGKAGFVGSADVCDYLDFIVAPGREKDFFTALFDDLKKKGIKSLDLNPLRPDSTVMVVLLKMAKESGYEAPCQQEAVSLELDLPPAWEDYLNRLSKKQRHEIRRKLRRLAEEGDASYRCIKPEGDPGPYMDTFVKLFTLSKKDEKARFMSEDMEVYFRSLAAAMARIGILRFGVLQVGRETTAMIMGFDYGDTMYLYNSAYDPKYDYLSVGLMSKLLCIKESIERGMKRWDFLKGGERYKYDTGGNEIPISNCRIILK